MKYPSSRQVPSPLASPRPGQIPRFLCVAALLAASGFAAEPPHVYFGNLHSHTSYSDGSGTPAEAYAYARDTAHLDFLAITEHNHAQAEADAPPDRKDGMLIAKNHALYEADTPTSNIGAAKAANEGGRFVAIYGQEYSTISEGNHANVFEVDRVIDIPTKRYDLLIEWLKTHTDSQGKEPIIQFNHPYNRPKDEYALEYGRDKFGGDANWIATVGHYVRTMEVLNGPATSEPEAVSPGVWKLVKPSENFEKQYLQFLALGFKVAPSADQDNHYKTWGARTDARTAVVCDQLTKAAVLDAIRARHVYATSDKNLRIIAHYNGALGGDEMPRPAQLTVSLDIRDDDEPNATYTIDLFGDKIGPSTAKLIQTKTAQGNNIASLPAVSAAGLDYAFVKVTQSGAPGGVDHAWIAPVWFK